MPRCPKPILPVLLKAVAAAAVLTVISGCAAFNGLVIVDVGDRSRLVDRDGQANGFECAFSAQSTTPSVLALEKIVTGTIRWTPLAASADDPH